MADAMRQVDGGTPVDQGAGPFPGTGDLQRVKVYKLNEAGLWDDRGTGHVTVEYMEVRPPPSMGSQYPSDEATSF